MRNLVSKLMTGGMIAGAALFVSACGKSEPAAADTNMATENSMESDMGTMNDVTAVDGAMGADGNMAMDNMSMSNDTMSNDSMASDNMSNGM